MQYCMSIQYSAVLANAARNVVAELVSIPVVALFELQLLCTSCSSFHRVMVRAVSINVVRFNILVFFSAEVCIRACLPCFFVTLELRPGLLVFIIVLKKLYHIIKINKSK